MEPVTGTVLEDMCNSHPHGEFSLICVLFSKKLPVVTKMQIIRLGINTITYPACCLCWNPDWVLVMPGYATKLWLWPPHLFVDPQRVISSYFLSVCAFLAFQGVGCDFLSLLRYHTNNIVYRIRILHVKRMCRKAWWLFPPTVWHLEWLCVSSDLPVQVIILTHLKQRWGPHSTCHSSGQMSTTVDCCLLSLVIFPWRHFWESTPYMRIHCGPQIIEWSVAEILTLGDLCQYPGQ